MPSQSAPVSNSTVVNDALKAAIPPYCVFGDIPMLNHRFTLHFSPDNESANSKAIRFPLDNPDAIAPLIEACKQAPFGVGRETVLDPEYRKALVLQGHQFSVAPATCVDPSTLGILSQVHRILLNNSGAPIYARLDKLNIYGVGDFFKEHVDTPRSNKMFGTLLINFPVAHQGGNLVVYAPNKNAEEWLAQQEGEQPSIDTNEEGRCGSYTTSWGDVTTMGWVAFFSDCPHEVLPVIQGNRVTLTFNLFFEGDDGNNGADSWRLQSRFSDPPVDRLVEALRLPGQFDKTRPRLCFHLQHRYPVNPNEDCAASARQFLKGRDAVIYRAVQKLGATISFHFVTLDTGFRRDDGIISILEEKALVTPHYTYQSDVSLIFSGVPLHELEAFTLVPLPEVQNEESGPCSVTGIEYSYNVNYGNEGADCIEYASICMIACIPGRDIREVWPKNDPYMH